VSVLNGKTGGWIRNLADSNNGMSNSPVDIEIIGHELYMIEYRRNQMCVYSLVSYFGDTEDGTYDFGDFSEEFENSIY